MMAGTTISPRYQLAIGVTCVVLASLLIRLPGVNRPLLGNFATKNVVYAMIARNWASGDAAACRPTLDVVEGGGPSWHMVEFPVSAYLTGALWRACGGSLDAWGRLTSAGFLAATVGLMFILVRRWHGAAAAWGASLVLALSPVGIIYGQSFMLEASVVFFTLAAVLATDLWNERSRWPWLLLAAAAFGLLLLTKIYMLVLVLPLVCARSPERLAPPRTGTLKSRLLLVLCLAIVSLPAILWYWDAYRMAVPGNPLADRLFYSVRHSAGVHRWPHPLLTSPDFYRQALDDLAGVALTPLGFALALAGGLHHASRRHWPWLAAMGALAVALPLKFYEMNYYYLVVLPPLCVLAGLGWRSIYLRMRPGRLAITGLLAVGLTFSLRHAARPAFVTPREDRAVLTAAREARALSADDDRVVTMHGSTIDLLYYCRRRGWAVPPDEEQLQARLAECRRQGAKLLVIAGDTKLRLPPHFPQLRQGTGYAIYSLLPEAAVAKTRSPE